MRSVDFEVADRLRSWGVRVRLDDKKCPWIK